MDILEALTGSGDPAGFISPQSPISPVDTADLDQLDPLCSSDLAGLLEVFANNTEEAPQAPPAAPTHSSLPAPEPAAGAAGDGAARATTAVAAFATGRPEQQRQQMVPIEMVAPGSDPTPPAAAATSADCAVPSRAAAGCTKTPREHQTVEGFAAAAAAAGVRDTPAHTTDTPGSPGNSSPSGITDLTASLLQTPTAAVAAAAGGAGTGAQPGKHVAASNAAAVTAAGPAAGGPAWPADNVGVLQLYTDKQTVITFESPDVSSFVSEWEHFQASRSMGTVTGMNMEVDMPMHMDATPHSMLGDMHRPRYPQQQQQHSPPGSNSAFNNHGDAAAVGPGISLAGRSTSLPTPPPALAVGSCAPGVARALSCGSSSRRLTFVPAAPGPAAAFNPAGAFSSLALPGASGAAAAGSGGGSFSAHTEPHNMQRCGSLGSYGGSSAEPQGIAAGHQGYPAGHPGPQYTLHPSHAGTHPHPHPHPHLQLQQRAGVGLTGFVGAAGAAGADAVYADHAGQLPAPGSFRRHHSMPGPDSQPLVAGQVVFGHHAAGRHTMPHHAMQGQLLHAPMHAQGAQTGLAAAELMYPNHQLPSAINPAMHNPGPGTAHEAAAWAPGFNGFERSMSAGMPPGAVLAGTQAPYDLASAHQGFLLQPSGSFKGFPVLHKQNEPLPFDQHLPFEQRQRQRQRQRERERLLGGTSSCGRHPSWPQHGVEAPSTKPGSPQLSAVDRTGFDSAAAAGAAALNSSSGGAGGPAAAAPVAPPVLPLTKEEIHPAALSVDPRLASLYEDDTQAFPVAVKRRVGRPRREERVQNAVGAALAQSLRASKPTSKQERGRGTGSKRSGSNGSNDEAADGRLAKRLRSSAAATAPSPFNDTAAGAGGCQLPRLPSNTSGTDLNTDQDLPSSPTAAAGGGTGTVRGGPSFSDLVQYGFFPTGTFRFKVGPMDKVVAEVSPCGAITWRGQRFTSISGFSRAVLRDRNPGRQSSGGWRDVQLGRTELSAWRIAYAAGQPAPPIPAECIVI